MRKKLKKEESQVSKVEGGIEDNPKKKKKREKKQFCLMK